MNSRVQLHVVKSKPAMITSVEPERAIVEAAARTACTRLHSALFAGSSPSTNALPGMARCDFAKAASLAAVTGATRLTMSPQWYAGMIQNGSIMVSDIAEALRESLSSHVEWLTVDDILQHARRADAAPAMLPTIADLVCLPGIDNVAALVEERIARWVCSGSMQLPRSNAQSPLYTAWHAAHRSSDDAGITGFAAAVDRLPVDASSLLHTAVDQLGLHLPGLADWFHRQLMPIEYVAACVPATLTPGQPGDDADILKELLAIRVAWDVCLFRLLRHHTGIETTWSQARSVLHHGGQEDRQIALDCVLQAAFEKGWQRRFLQQLQRPLPVEAQVRPALQAIFCSSGRAESFRRALEACSPLIETLGHAAVATAPVARAVAVGQRLSVSRQADLAAIWLGQLCLQEKFAPLVLVAGHGCHPAAQRTASTSACPVCTGNDGVFDPAMTAAMLNDPDVRRLLAGRGFAIPADTLFVAAWQDAATSAVTLVNEDDLPASHAEEIDALRAWLADARATVDAATVCESVCAAFIAAPRAITRDVDFGSTTTLVSYDWQRDTDASVLTGIMTTTLLRTTLQSMQDYRITVADTRNSAALHPAPLRLAAVLAAPVSVIDSIIARHANLRALINNRWLHVFAWSACGQKILRRQPNAGWTLFRRTTPSPEL